MAQQDYSLWVRGMCMVFAIAILHFCFCPFLLFSMDKFRRNGLQHQNIQALYKNSLLAVIISHGPVPWQLELCSPCSGIQFVCCQSITTLSAAMVVFSLLFNSTSTPNRTVTGHEFHVLHDRNLVTLGERATPPPPPPPPLQCRRRVFQKRRVNIAVRRRGSSIVIRIVYSADR